MKIAVTGGAGFVGQNLTVQYNSHVGIELALTAINDAAEAFRTELQEFPER